MVFSDISSATPRTMKELPRVTMKAGTFSLAMIAPLSSPTTTGAADRGEEPDDDRGKERQPGVERGADGERREHRGEAHDPADGKVDAGADNDEGLAEAEEQDRRDRDEDVLRIPDVRKLTEPPLLAIGTATTKKTIIRPRKAHAHSRLSVR